MVIKYRTKTSLLLLFILSFFQSLLFFFQDVIRCIGGIKIFLPLLEQISYFEPRKPSRVESNNKQLEVLDLEQSEAITGRAIER